MDLWLKINMTILIVSFFSFAWIKYRNEPPKNDVLGWLIVAPLIVGPISNAIFLLFKIWL